MKHFENSAIGLSCAMEELMNPELSVLSKILLAMIVGLLSGAMSKLGQRLVERIGKK